MQVLSNPTPNERMDTAPRGLRPSLRGQTDLSQLPSTEVFRKLVVRAQRSKVTPAPAWEVLAPTCSGRKSSGHPGSILSAISRGEGGELDTCSVPASLNFLGVGNSHCTWKPPKSLACHRGGGQCWRGVPSGSSGLQLPGERETGICWLRPPRCPLSSRRISGLDP